MAWTPTVVDLVNNISTIKTTPAVVRGVYINKTLSAHACNINDGTTTIFIIEASKAAGSIVDFAGDEGVVFDTNIIVDPDDAATGSLTILYKDKAP